MQNSADRRAETSCRTAGILLRGLVGIVAAACLAGCSSSLATVASSAAVLTPPTSNKRDLLHLPQPMGKIKVAVYNFRDQTGQYKPLPGVSSFSTAVSQGGATMLVQALKDSGWFIPVEREGLQNLLTERKIVRAFQEKQGLNPEKELPPLDMASLLIEGGIIGYDTNVVTGGLGAKYFGIGGQIQYRVDQVTVSLRAIDVNNGRILKTVSTTKTVLSRELTAGVFRYVSFKRLLEAEGGITTNEPVLVAVLGAIEKGVASLIIEGLGDKLWSLKDSKEMDAPVIREYYDELRGTVRDEQAGPSPDAIAGQTGS